MERLAWTRVPEKKGATARLAEKRHFFVSTHHRNTGPKADWNSFVSLVEESMYTPEQIEKMNRSSAQRLPLENRGEVITTMKKKKMKTR